MQRQQATRRWLVATRGLRSSARATVFVLKVLPMLPSRFLNRVTPTPRVDALTYPSAHGPVTGELYRPASAGPHPGIVVCLGVVPFEVNHPQIPRLGEALARAGFAALLYWSPAMRDKRLASDDIEGIALAYDCLISQPWIDGRRSGLFGTCVGGSFALMAAAHPLIRERVGFVGAFAPYASMTTMTIGIASGTRAGERGREEWAVDPLTRDVYAHTLAALLTAHDVDLPDGPQPLLAAEHPEEVEAALAALPDAVQAELTRLSPLSYLNDIHAQEIALGHDRDDVVIPLGESRQLWRALDGRPGLRYTEFAMFQHMDPTKRGLPLPQLLWQLGKFYRYVLPLFRQSQRV